MNTRAPSLFSHTLLASALLSLSALLATTAHAEGSANPAKGAKAEAAADATVTTASGLKYRDTLVGTGRTAQAGDSVSVHYTGWLQNPDGSKGNKFDSSLDRGRPFVFPLGGGRVIKGWDEGVAGMKQGGKRTLTIPAKLAYGDREVGGGLIPAGSTLIFDVELVGF
jgi:FKBP-type peptidyl-prolyl cis-trans isomerase FkpA